MSFRPSAILVFAVLLLWARGISAQQANLEDRDLKVLEARLQEQRAGAVRSRLILYTDELQKLQSQFAASGDTASADAVKAELEAVRLAMNRVTQIARGQTEPASAEELKDVDAANSTALAAKRINATIAHFDREKSGGAGRNGSSGPARQHVLKFERAARNRDYSDYQGARYWAHPSSYATWAVDDIAPGDYEVFLRFTAGENAGGKAVIKAAGQELEVTVTKSEKGQSQRERRVSAGIISVKETGVDVRVENGGLAKGADSLWNLEAVTLQPVSRRP
jgi:hypothetical protein